MHKPKAAPHGYRLTPRWHPCVSGFRRAIYEVVVTKKAQVLSWITLSWLVANLLGLPRFGPHGGVTRLGNGLVVGCPGRRDIVPQRGSYFGENISKVGRRCISFFI